MTSPENLNDAADELRATKPNVHIVDYLGLVAGLVPFGLSYSETVTTYVDATSISRIIKKHMDYVALGGGAFTIACAAIGLMHVSRMRTRALRIAVFLALFALGAFQIIRGVLANAQHPI